MAQILEACAHEAARALGTRYGLEDPALGVRLEGGYANDLFRLDAGGRAWVLRIERPPIDEESLAWEHAVLGQLCERLPEVCAPVTARNGTTWFAVRDRVAWLMPLVRGAPADPGRTAHRDAAAAALGRIHAVGAELGLAPRPRHEALPRMTWPPLEPVAPLADLAEEIAAARAWAVDFVRRLAAERRPRVGFVHNDFFPGNVMIDGDELTAVLDWEESRLDWVSFDLANALGSFCFAGDELDRGAARRFLTTYRNAGGTAPLDEEDLLLPLMRVKRTLEVLRAPTDREPRWEHQRHNVRAMTELARG